MTSLLRRALARSGDEERYSLTDWNNDLYFQFQNATYPITGIPLSGSDEEIETSFTGYCKGAYKANGVVFSTVLARMLLFTEARFQFQQMRNGQPGDLFGTPELSILETPWPNGTTGELLARMEQDVSLGGNAYIVREGSRLRRLRPDWVTIILTAAPDEAVEADVAGYLYQPGGKNGRGTPRVFTVDEVCHWSPIPDPEAQYRGMSWITPVLNDIAADKLTTEHKRRFFNNAATPNIAVMLKETVPEEEFRKFMAAMESAHTGAHNAYKTLYLGGGADVKPIGVDFRQLDFKNTQGAGETRVTAAGGVPAVIVGLSEGLQAATYSNYGQARRKFGDHWARPQWRSVSAALASIIRVPSGARLWYDERHIAFLREDEKDAADIKFVQAQTMRQWIDAGYEPASVTAAMVNDDIRLLKHSGLFSVQLQTPGSQMAPAQEETP